MKLLWEVTEHGEGAAGGGGSVPGMEVGLISWHKPEENPSRDCPGSCPGDAPDH